MKSRRQYRKKDSLVGIVNVQLWEESTLVRNLIFMVVVWILCSLIMSVRLLRLRHLWDILPFTIGCTTI